MPAKATSNNYHSPTVHSAKVESNHWPTLYQRVALTTELLALFARTGTNALLTSTRAVPIAVASKESDKMPSSYEFPARWRVCARHNSTSQSANWGGRTRTCTAGLKASALPLSYAPICNLVQRNNAGCMQPLGRQWSTHCSSAWRTEKTRRLKISYHPKSRSIQSSASRQNWYAFWAIVGFNLQPSRRNLWFTKITLGRLIYHVLFSFLKLFRIVGFWQWTRQNI